MTDANTTTPPASWGGELVALPSTVLNNLRKDLMRWSDSFITGWASEFDGNFHALVGRIETWAKFQLNALATPSPVEELVDELEGVYSDITAGCANETTARTVRRVCTALSRIGKGGEKPAFDPATSPSHTDLMVSPEEIDRLLTDSPTRSEGEVERLKPLDPDIKERIEDAIDCAGVARDDDEYVPLRVGDLRALLDAAAPASTSSGDGGEVDYAELDRLFSELPDGPWTPILSTGGWEVRQVDTDPTNKHHWPTRLCQNIEGQFAGFDEAAAGFIAAILNTWPTIRAALTANPTGEEG